MADDAFAGHVVLITGAASGFGHLLAARLSSAGARLVLGDRDAAGLETAAALLRVNTPDIVTRVCDVTREADVEALVATAVSAFGRLDIAVNNAGATGAVKPLVDTTETDLDFAYAVNAKGVFFGVKHQIRQMLTQEDGGAILNVSSLAGIGAGPRLAAYSAAKHAVIGITRTAAAEHARDNIRVNAVCPYYSPTPLLSDGPLAGRAGRLAEGSPMKRLPAPEEVVAAMIALIAPDNSFVNGQALAVDGGISAF
ncbi:SDR family NAD(P)-dependent oxidoreductase [Stappia sp. ES.058]|uniref:SDR family NAD(P)-dependent oxidoreductase n=1 Tax=Stappia sp. ES.058 TaxID=1881061 RepID=UPI00087D3431|nr:SDR family oxidoreductase [Stappia sp. ES.058]SDU31996.1 NAD(P)-dependent dehydrogenase, short-chain alcohol dehydrogenase family [Stappia sp. ES.058]